jgi:hypothetical protein
VRIDALYDDHFGLFDPDNSQVRDNTCDDSPPAVG